MRCRNGNGQGLKAGTGDLGNFRARRKSLPAGPSRGCLTFDRKPRLRGNGDVLLSGGGGTCRASTSTHCTPDQRALAATGEGADQRTRGGASADVLNVALVVVGASAPD